MKNARDSAPRVLVTGVSGFVGRHMVDALRSQQVGAIYGVAASSRSSVELQGYASLTFGAPESSPRLHALLREWKPDWIFHLVGRPRSSLAGTIESNSLAAAQLLDAVKVETPGAAVLVLGSAAEFGPVNASDLPLREDHPCRPESPYGIAKHAQTLLAQDASRRGLCVLIARPFNLIGAGVPTWLLPGAILARAKAALAGGSAQIDVGNVSARRDYLAIEDAARAFIDIIRSRRAGAIFNVCSGESVPIRHVVETLLAFFPTSIRYQADSQGRRGPDPADIVGDSGKLRALCGWTPRVSLEDSLRAAYDAALAPGTIE